MPEVLYIAIGNFIKESLSYDHKKLITGFEFLEQLKPSLRSRLVHELFPKFFKEFDHLFEFELAICGKEFMAYFVTKLYCRLFMGNQIIIKKGDYFEEIYMIFQGKITLSLEKKDVNEYFQLYRTNYIGDYQILMNLKSSECFKASSNVSTYCYCIKSNEFLDLLLTFPDAKVIFMYRAQARRLEFRRIKKLYEIEARVNPDSMQDEADVKILTKFHIKYYSD